VDGEKYTKFGTTTPPIVSDVLNIRELELNGNKEQLNFWDQMDYPFLLNRSGGDLFKFIVDSGDNDQVSKALKSMVSDRQLLSKDIDVLQGSINLIDLDITNLSEQLESLKEQAEVSNTVISLKPKVLRLTYMNQIKDRVNNIDKERDEVSIECTKATNTFIKYHNIYETLSDIYNKINILNNISIKLNSVIGDLSGINESLNKKAKYKDLLNFDFDYLDSLKNEKISIDNIKRDLVVNENLIKSIPKFDFDFSCNEKLLDLKNKRMKLDEIKESIRECCDLDLSYKDKIKGLDELLNLFDVCPLCGNKLHF
jgi:hypothetical protein